MATLNSLKRELRQKAIAATSYPTQPLSDTQYSEGFNILVQSSGRAIYLEFVIPQLTLLLSPLFFSRSHVSVLEIGPGSKSVLGSLSSRLRQKIQRYAAFEPNQLFATGLENWLSPTSGAAFPLPCLRSPPDIRRVPFSADSDASIDSGSMTMDGAEKFDVVLFCHSMYGMHPKRKFIERALEMTMERSQDALVVVLHRDGTLHFDGLTCYQTACFPTGVVDVPDDDGTLDRFAPFIAGFTLQDTNAEKLVQVEWRKVCRALGRRGDGRPGRLLFSSPNIMVAFTQHATALPKLTAQVPLARKETKVKNREARLHQPASVVRPTEIRHVQDCVRWALNHRITLTVTGGGHSGHCMWPNVVSVDMGAFTHVYIHKTGEGGAPGSYPGALVVAEAGCKSGDIVREALVAGLTVPMGSRPSVGAGLWLQGGIGHLARLHGLTCDAIVGAVMVSAISSQILHVGHVPSQHRPVGSMRPENENDLLWAIKGAGTNFGIVVSVALKAHPAPTYSIRNSIFPLNNNFEARLKLSEYAGFVTAKLSRNCSADAYLYWDMNKLHLGVTMFEASATLETLKPAATRSIAILGPESIPKTVDMVGLFDSDMYMSGMHGGHAGSKTSSFKRCVFVNRVNILNVLSIVVAAMETRPSPFCYFHLLQGGGAVRDIANNATAFGCRDWDFACVVTGVWPRNQDGCEVERAAVAWVYDVAGDLLPLSSGAYGADLGPDPRDATLAAKAFGINRLRLAHLKRSWDPSYVLAHACPLQQAQTRQRLIFLVTGESCSGKDYCADIWVSIFNKYSHTNLKACSVSISDAVKEDFANSTGADLMRLLSDRPYKEKHRSALSAYFQDQIRKRPSLPEEHFLDVVHSTTDMDVVFVTGMRDEAPLAAFSHLVPGVRLLEVRVKSSERTREVRRGCQGCDDNTDDNKSSGERPSLIFNNDKTGNEEAKRFAEECLLHLFHRDIERLGTMVRSVPDFPRPGIEYRHILGISQQPGGLALCTSLLHKHFTGTWEDITVLLSCEAGGFVFASALAVRVGLPLVLVREAGKLPPPTISVTKCPSHISSSESKDTRENRVEIGRDAITRGASVVVIDDVLATGKTLCAVLQLLVKAGIGAENVSVMVVAEFPFHRGRDLLRRQGFGRARIQSLLVCEGA